MTDVGIDLKVLGFRDYADMNVAAGNIQFKFRPGGNKADDYLASFANSEIKKGFDKRLKKLSDTTTTKRFAGFVGHDIVTATPYEGSSNSDLQDVISVNLRHALGQQLSNELANLSSNMAESKYEGKKITENKASLEVTAREQQPIQLGPQQRQIPQEIDSQDSVVAAMNPMRQQEQQQQ